MQKVVGSSGSLPLALGSLYRYFKLKKRRFFKAFFLLFNAFLLFSFCFLEQKSVGSSGSLPLALGNTYISVFGLKGADFLNVFRILF